MSDASDGSVKLGHWHEVLRRAQIGRTTKGVALVLASYANTDGENIFPSIAVLSVAAEVTYKTAKKAVAELIAYGLIEVVARRRGGKGRFDEYRLILAPDLLTRVRVLDPDEYAKAAEMVRIAVRSAPDRGKRVHPIDAPSVPFDLVDNSEIGGTASPVISEIGGTAFPDRVNGTSGVSLISTSHEKAISHVPRLRAARTGLGFCVTCYAEGQTTVAADAEAGSFCSVHLRLQAAS